MMISTPLKSLKKKNCTHVYKALFVLFLSLIPPYCVCSRDSSVSTATFLRVGRQEFDSRQAHPASYPMGTMVLSSGVNQPKRESDHSPRHGAEVKNAPCLV
jgi:hypothetical protein